MSLTFRSMLLLAVLVPAALLGRPGEGGAQPAAATPDVLASLLVEVRGLRAAMEQMAAAGPRVQLALGRLQLQEQRVTNMMRRLEEIRTALVTARSHQDEVTARLGRMEHAAREAPNAEERRQAEEVTKELKHEAARATAEAQRLQTEEGTLLQDISAEQGRWTEFNRRLEELERSLEPRRQ